MGCRAFRDVDCQKTREANISSSTTALVGWGLVEDGVEHGVRA